MFSKANTKPTIVQKTLVRGTQKSTQTASVKSHTSPSLYQQQQHKNIRTGTTATASNDKYRAPQLQATMGLANQIDQFKAKTGPKYNDVCDLTPRSKAVVTERVKFCVIFNIQICGFNCNSLSLVHRSHIN